MLCGTYEGFYTVFSGSIIVEKYENSPRNFELKNENVCAINEPLWIGKKKGEMKKFEHDQTIISWLIIRIQSCDLRPEKCDQVATTSKKF